MVPLWVGREGCRRHADVFTLTAQKLLFNVSQSDMQEHRPTVRAGKRHGGAGEVVQQGPYLVVMQALMGADSTVTRHHGEQMMEHPRQALIEAVVCCWKAQYLENIHQGCGVVAFCQ